MNIIYLLKNHMNKINNIHMINKRYLQSFHSSLLYYSRKINARNIDEINDNRLLSKSNLFKTKTSIDNKNSKTVIPLDLTITQFNMSKEKYTEYNKNYCEYCKGCGIIICMECETKNNSVSCHKCNGYKYITCFICNGSGKSHRIF